MNTEAVLTLALALHHCRGGSGPALARAVREAGSIAKLAELVGSGSLEESSACPVFSTPVELSTEQLSVLAGVKPNAQICAPRSSTARNLRISGQALDSVLPGAKIRQEAEFSRGAEAVKEAEERKRRIEKDLAWSNKERCTLLCYDSTGYPPQLRETDCPPLLLYVRGSVEALSSRQLAIVGSRRASDYGKRNAYWMARELTAAGISICSGLALGIDAQAHSGALDAAADCFPEQLAPTVAVIGTGIDRIYPARHAALSEQIAAQGALVSEFPLGTLAYPYNFPRRNRLISGLSEGVLVVEAAIKSGSLITARCALEQNRDVYAMPGLLSNPQGRGCHTLIKQGAMLVDEPADILKEFGVAAVVAPDSAQAEFRFAKAPWQQLRDETLGSQEKQETGKPGRIGNGLPQNLAPLQRQLLQRLRTEDCLFDSLLDANVADFRTLNHALLDLEVRGLVACRGGRYTLA